MKTEDKIEAVVCISLHFFLFPAFIAPVRYTTMQLAAFYGGRVSRVVSGRSVRYKCPVQRVAQLSPRGNDVARGDGLRDAARWPGMLHHGCSAATSGGMLISRGLLRHWSSGGTSTVGPAGSARQVQSHGFHRSRWLPTLVSTDGKTAASVARL